MALFDSAFLRHCATLKKITYYGVPSDISNVRIKLRLVKGDTVKTLVYDHQGNLV